MGLLGACLRWNRACSRSLRPGWVAVVIVPDLACLSSSIERPELAGSRTAPARSAHAHRPACLAASLSAAQCQSAQGLIPQVGQAQFEVEGWVAYGADVDQVGFVYGRAVVGAAEEFDLDNHY